MLAEKLLKACPKLKILTTSREALKCIGEQTHTILSLEIPNLKDEISIEQLVQYESVRLFIERALEVNTRFRVNNENAHALAGICSRLDGIPLAIELAAARIKVLTVEKIYERLSNRFDLLTGGKRTALPRQQTLRALIDWSYDLLSEQEKILWSRLSVFNNGWSLESAEEICSDAEVKIEHVFDLLSLLVEKSILIYDEENERYNILETLKRYGEEKLKGLNQTNEVFTKHLLYFMELSELAEGKLVGPEGQFWLDKLEKEHGNLQSAIEWSLQGYPEEGMRLAGALSKFWDIRGYFSIGRRLLESMFGNTEEVNKLIIGKALKCACTLAYNQGDNQQALEYCKKSLKLYNELEDKEGISTSLHNLGILTYEQGDYEKARNIFEEHLEYNRLRGDKDSIAGTLNDLGNMTYDQGDYGQAQKFYEESLALREELSDKRGIAFSYNNLGNVSNNQGDYEKALKLYEKSLAIKRELGDKKGITVTLHNIGLLCTYKGDYKLAKKFFEESLALANKIGDKQGIAETLYYLGSIEFKQENFEQAKKLYEKSLILRRGIGSKLGMIYSIMGLADIAGVKNHYSKAANLLGFVNAALNSMNAVLTRFELNLYEEAIKNLHQYLNDEEFSENWETGRKLTLEQAAELAITF